MKTIKIAILIILTLVWTFAFGFHLSQIIFNNNTETPSCVEGYFFRNTTQPEFWYGDWVCVNIQGMDFGRAIEVCKHETGHEIFAEFCEENWEECENLTK